MAKHAVIIANGELPSSAKVRKILRTASTVVCADGGARHALEMGVQPDIVIGDLDSLPLRVRSRLKQTLIIEEGNQNQTDLEKALRYLLRQKVKRITILGATGKRIDQTIANISLLDKYSLRVRIIVVDRTGTIEVVRSKVKFQATPGETISLLPLGKAAGVTTKGLLYPLKDETLEPGIRGVSNEVISRNVEIRVRRGKLLLVRLFAGRL